MSNPLADMRRPTGPEPSHSPYDPQAKSRIAAGALAIALGWLGVRRFSLGHVAIGIAQIVPTLLTSGLGRVWTIIEGVLVRTRDRRLLVDAPGRPLRD